MAVRSEVGVEVRFASRLGKTRKETYCTFPRSLFFTTRRASLKFLLLASTWIIFEFAVTACLSEVA
jgi:hypothetical protein